MLWSGLGSNILIFKTILPSIKHILIFRTDILTFSKHVLPFTKHILILRTDNTCFFKQVLISPYRYYLRYRCYRTCQQELSCIKQSGQSISYSKFHSIRWNEYNIWSITRWFVTSLDNSWCYLEAMSVFLVFIILPPADTQISIFEIICQEYGKRVSIIYCVK